MKHDIFSKRDVPDSEVLSYSIPTELRVQVIHIWDDVFRTILKYERNLKALMYYHTVQILRKEYGVMALLPTLPYSDDEAELRGFFLDQATVDERVVDVIELSFRVLSNAANDRAIEPEPSSLTLGAVKDAINELNERFREHGIGYEYIDGIVIRKDSEYIHSEVVKPALLILNEKEFRGARDEFLEAHKHYLQKDYKAALNDCLKSFESVMISICDERKWNYPKGANAKALIDVCFKNNLIPSHWQSQFSALRSLLESGVPTGRNRISGHGQGQTPTPVPEHIAKFMMHQTATVNVFLGDAYAEIRSLT